MRIKVSTSYLTLISLLYLINPAQAQKFRTLPVDIPYPIEETSTGNIIINEIMFDPEPSRGLPNVEYIELFNRSDKGVDLGDWEINGIKITEFILESLQYAILCHVDHIRLFQAYGNVVGLNDWDPLNNTGQLITLTDHKNNYVDQFHYLPSMISDPGKRKGGWSLELINPWQICKKRLNWDESIDHSGGTPGSENSIFSNEPDNSPPEILSIIWLNEMTLEIKFSEPMDPVSSVHHLNYMFVPDAKVKNITLSSSGAEKITIDFSGPISRGQLYEIHINNIADCSDIPFTDTIVYTGIGKMPEFSDILITELMIDEEPAAGLPESEYMEILNNSDALTDLSDIKIIREKDTFDLYQRLLLPGEYLVIIPEKNAVLYENIKNILGITPFPRLSNEDLTLAIVNVENRLISSVSYTDKWYRALEKSVGGYSLEMVDISNPCGEENNWRASDDPSGGTPGRQNSVTEQNPDLSSPYIYDAVALSPDSLLIQISERLHPQSKSTLSIEISNSLKINDIHFEFPLYNKLYIHLSEALKSRTEYQITMTGVKDCVENSLSPENNTITIQLPEKADSMDLVINEILFNPMPLGVDWVEIYNKSSKHIKLKNVGLGSYRGNTDRIYRIYSEISILRPEEYVVITTDVEALMGDFPSGIPEKVIEIRQLPSLPDQAGNVILFSEKNDVIDFMEYKSSYHHPLLRNDEGVSLERISATASSLDQSNWQSASSVSGYGTPTRKNSNDISNSASRNFISIENELFSPDGDHYLDEMIVNYHLSEPGYIANIDIFNLSGQKVATILHGKMIGIEGSISWNGRNERGGFAKPGYYIIALELYNSNGDFFRIKEKCAVVYMY